MELRVIRISAEQMQISVELRRILSQVALSRRLMRYPLWTLLLAPTKLLALPGEISVFLLSTKLTLGEDRLVKQIVWDIKKTESVIRLSRSGSTASNPPEMIRRPFACRRRERGRWTKPAP